MLKSHIEQSGERREIWAARLGIGEAYLSQLVNGRKQPSLELAVRIERLTAGAVPASSWVADDVPTPSASETVAKVA